MVMPLARSTPGPSRRPTTRGIRNHSTHRTALSCAPPSSASESLEDLLDIGGGAQPLRAGRSRRRQRKFSSLVGGTWGIGGATDFGSTGDSAAVPRVPTSRSRRRRTDVRAPSRRRPPAQWCGHRLGSGKPSCAGRCVARRIDRPQATRRVRWRSLPGRAVRSRGSGATVPAPESGPQRVHARLDVMLSGAGNREPTHRSARRCPVSSDGRPSAEASRRLRRTSSRAVTVRSGRRSSAPHRTR